MSAMKSGLLGLLLVLVLVSGMAGGAGAAQLYVVQPGDTLSSIAEKFYGDPRKSYLILRANQDALSRTLNSVEVGSELFIPELHLETAPTYGVAQGERDTATGLVMMDLVAAPMYPPYSGEDLPNGGIFTEIVTTAFSKLGYKPTITFAALGPAPKAADLGAFAATFPHLESKDLRRSFLVSDGILPVRSFLFWRRGSGVDYAGIGDLRGRRVCTTRSLYDAVLKDLADGAGLDLMLPERVIDCFLAIMRDEVDAVVAGELDGGAAVSALGLENEIRTSQAPLHTGVLCVLFPKLSAHGRVLRYQFNETIAKMKASGALDRIIERHLRPGAHVAIGPSSGKAFAVHLATEDSKAAAVSAWQDLQQSFPGLLGPMELFVQPVDVGGGAWRHRVLAWSLPDRSSANSACDALQAKDQYCLAVPVHALATAQNPAAFAVVLAAFSTQADAARYLSWVQENMRDNLGDVQLETDSAVNDRNGEEFRVITEPLPSESMAREVCARLAWPVCQVVQR